MDKPLKAELQAAIASYPVAVQQQVLRLRAEIQAVAASSEGVGELLETLKWGELSFVTEQSKSGSTLRVAWQTKQPEYLGLYVNCKTSLVDSYQTLFPGLFVYQKQRALLLPLNQAWPLAELRICIAMALRYHLDKRKH
ncbi:DUF1801 domain-containing protein [Agarivorans aestuarii]|uniref:DUF1801 domain-containing protein n=1 Tax=Agarivorans aestuarii TaxID=1563703 RepID=A0ABU7G6Q7_9ALTE|nr:DUF1801 domain-containing protein [Agarivorans aestuarii]MEE1674993.1 DUF1801 domain-containing protein [Agarivorans aestuarii]